MASELIEAIRASDVKAAREAIASGAKLNELQDGLAPLHWAIYRGDFEMVKLLLESGANPNVQTLSGDSPLWHAEDDFGLTEIAELLKSGAAK